MVQRAGAITREFARLATGCQGSAELGLTPGRMRSTSSAEEPCDTRRRRASFARAVRSPKFKKTGKKPVPLGPWPTEARSPEEVAAEVQYLGSPEHKDYANPINGEAPHQRSDGFRCKTYPQEKWAEFTAALRAAVVARCTSADFDPDQRPGHARTEGWPRYVWGWFEGKVFEARHRTDPPGCYYKAYLLEPEQHPEDPEGRLAAARPEAP